MWLLQRKSDGKILYLLNKEYVVGRNKHDPAVTILITEDESISRKHLKFKVDYCSQTQQDTTPGVLQVMDLGSLYGTTVSNMGGKIEKQQWVTLEVGSVIQFGAKNTWMVKWMDILVLCSALSGRQEKIKLDESLLKLGGVQVSNWRDDVTHLVVGELKFTEKVVDGLLRAKPLVNVDFFVSWISILDQNPEASHPDFKDFVPPIHQESLGRFQKQNFLPDENRKYIFREKTFVFFTEHQHRAMATSVIKAGGQAIMDSVRPHQDEDILVEPNPRPFGAEFIARMEKVKFRGKRAITMKELMYAIVASSTQRFTNPMVNNDSSVFRTIATRLSSAPAAEHSIYAPETQTQLEDETKNPMEPPCKKTRVEMTQDYSSLGDQDIVQESSLVQQPLPVGPKKTEPAPQHPNHPPIESNKLKRKLSEDNLQQRPVDSPTSERDEKQPHSKRKKPSQETFQHIPQSEIPTPKPSNSKIMNPKTGREGVGKSNLNETLNETYGGSHTRYRLLHNTVNLLNDSSAKATVRNLFRPNCSLGEGSQNTSKCLPVKEIEPRFRSLKLHIRKEGRWAPK